jgi:hypothetical protein
MGNAQDEITTAISTDSTSGMRKQARESVPGKRVRKNRSVGRDGLPRRIKVTTETQEKVSQILLVAAKRVDMRLDSHVLNAICDAGFERFHSQLNTAHAINLVRAMYWPCMFKRKELVIAFLFASEAAKTFRYDEASSVYTSK